MAQNEPAALWHHGILLLCKGQMFSLLYALSGIVRLNPVQLIYNKMLISTEEMVEFTKDIKLYKLGKELKMNFLLKE